MVKKTQNTVTEPLTHESYAIKQYGQDSLQRNEKIIQLHPNNSNSVISNSHYFEPLYFRFCREFEIVRFKCIFNP